MANAKVRYENFWRTSLRLQPETTDPDVSLEIAQSLSRLMGWDYTNGLWRPALADADGRLLVSTGAVKTNVVTQASGNVGGGAVTAVAENPNRKLYWVQAAGVGDIYVSLNPTFTLGSAIRLLPGMMWIDDIYYGTVRVASDGSGNYNWRSGEMV